MSEEKLKIEFENLKYFFGEVFIEIFYQDLQSYEIARKKLSFKEIKKRLIEFGTIDQV